jgi:hypothetical protein
VVLNTEECGTNPTGFGALRADTDGDGNAFNDEGNFWKSNDIIGLTGGCNGEDGIAWEKFQLVVTLADVVCPSTRRLRGPIPVTSGSKFIVPP